jgi:hypothetical protein
MLSHAFDAKAITFMPAVVPTKNTNKIRAVFGGGRKGRIVMHTQVFR